MNTKLLDFLVKTGLIGPQQVRAVANRQQQTGGWLIDTLLELCRISDVDLARALGQFHQYNVIDIARVHPRPAALDLLARDVARRYCALPFSFDRSGETLLVAVVDPEYASPALDLIQQVWPRPKQIFIAPRQALLSAIDSPVSATSTVYGSMSSSGSVSRASRPHVSLSGGRSSSRPDFDTSNYDTNNSSNPWSAGLSPHDASAPQLFPAPQTLAPAATAQALNELRETVRGDIIQTSTRLDQATNRIDQLEQSLQNQIPARLQQLDQTLQTRISQVAKDVAHDVAQGVQHHIQHHAQQTEQKFQAEIAQLQAENQSLRLQVQRIERTLQAEVDLLRQLLTMLLEQPQTDRKLYAERTAPLR